MITFIKNVEMMSKAELRKELSACREIIDDIYDEIQDGPKAETAAGKQNLINQISRYCYRKMPE